MIVENKINQIPSVGHLKYDKFKQNIKQHNFVEYTLEVISCNSDDNYHPSSTINLCRYLAEHYDDEFITAAGDSRLTFSGQKSAVETTSMMSDVGLYISQLRILFILLQNKLSANLFIPEKIIKNLSGDMIIPKVGEYNYFHENRNKPKLILFWIRDTVAVFKKESQLLIDSGDINIYDINRIYIVVGSDHRQGASRFPMKTLYIMNNSKIHESIQPVGYILCKTNNGTILKNTTMKNVRDSINLLNESMSFNNQHLSPYNIYLICHLEFLVILLGKEHSSPHWCIKCKSPSKYRKLSDHSMDDE